MVGRCALVILVLTVVATHPGTAPAADQAAPECTDALDPQAALRAGIAYDTGVGAAQDFLRAARCYRRAATAGIAQAQFNLGALYDNGRGMPRDALQAAHWYELAAAQGDGRAAYALGLMAETGDGVAPDRAAARKWYGMALAEGIAAARIKVEQLDRASGAMSGSSQREDGNGAPTFKDAEGRRCRLIQSPIIVEGRLETALATECRDKHGRWVLTGPSPQP